MKHHHSLPCIINTWNHFHLQDHYQINSLQSWGSSCIPLTDLFMFQSCCLAKTSQMAENAQGALDEHGSSEWCSMLRPMICQRKSPSKWFGITVFVLGPSINRASMVLVVDAEPSGDGLMLSDEHKELTGGMTRPPQKGLMIRIMPKRKQTSQKCCGRLAQVTWTLVVKPTSIDKLRVTHLTTIPDTLKPPYTTTS